MIGVLSQSAPEKHNQGKKPINLCAPREFLQNVSAIFENHTILLFWIQNKYKLFAFLVERYAFRVLFTWSRHTSCAKDHGLFYLNNEVRKSDRMERNGNWGRGEGGVSYLFPCILHVKLVQLVSFSWSKLAMPGKTCSCIQLSANEHENITACL